MGDIADYYRDIKLNNTLRKEKSFIWWRQRDGTKVSIKNMTKAHIINCITKIDKEEWRKDWKEPLLKELKLRE